MSEIDTPGTGSNIKTISPKKRVKNAWRNFLKHSPYISLKQWARSLNAEEHGELAAHAETWSTNKALAR